MRYFFTLLLLISLVSIVSSRSAENEKYVEIELDFITEDDPDLALEENFMEDVESNYVYSDQNVLQESEHSLFKRATNWDSKTRPELHILYYVAIVIVVVLIVVGLGVWICCPCNCCKCGRG